MSNSDKPTDAVVIEKPKAFNHHALRNADIVGVPTSINTGIHVLIVGTTTGYHWQVWLGTHLLRINDKQFPSFAEAEDDARTKWTHAFLDAIVASGNPRFR